MYIYCAKVSVNEYNMALKKEVATEYIEETRKKEGTREEGSEKRKERGGGDEGEKEIIYICPKKGGERWKSSKGKVKGGRGECVHRCPKLPAPLTP